ncbi:UDP-N-acetylglucosamine transferase subunit ALG14 [Syncephalis plumigaleata]|nr:UDP-N-acetylglucosamine transferase subunit ALG14 [Syncephalis plumigaleata]
MASFATSNAISWQTLAIYVLTGISFLLIVLVIRLWQIIPSLHGQTSKPLQLERDICRVTILLGSGGHTAEMLALLNALTLEQYTPRNYLITEGDTLSKHRVMRWESSSREKSSNNDKTYTVCQLPRARRVGQSFLTTPWSVIVSTVAAFRIIWQQSPDLFLCNGPGSCVSVYAVILIYRLLGLMSTRVIYVESFARTQSLSLTGRILYPVVDCFVVQWPALREKYPRAIYSGILI